MEGKSGARYGVFVSAGREMKYLGVWFEPGRGWRKQGRVLEAEYRSLVGRLAGVSIALQQMVYIINTTVVPSLTYPLVVATVAQGTMDTWDRGLRRLVAKSGGLPKTLPIHLYYAPVEKGGLGLRSIVDTVDRLKVMAYMSAGDDLDLGDRGAEWRGEGAGSLYSRFAVQARRRYEASESRGRVEQGTVEAEVRGAVHRLGMQIKNVACERHILRAAAEDRVRAETSDVVGGDMLAYTDGGLDPGPQPRAGWGAVLMRAASRRYVRREGGSFLTADGSETLEMWGRLQGEQNNSHGEAMALLQVLRHTPLQSGLTVMIDNTGVIDRWGSMIGHGSERLKRGGRAMWSRIFMLMRARNKAGSRTEIEWIHSHVEEEERRVRRPCREGQTNKLRVCACGGDEKGDCVPHHYHHIGNEWADKLADRGKMLQPSSSQQARSYGGHRFKGGARYEGQLMSQHGEDMWVVMDHEGRHVQGDITVATAAACLSRRMKALASGTSERGRTWARMQYACWDGSMRLHATAGFRRFSVRLLAQCLPTYANIVKRIGTGDNIYGFVWGEAEGMQSCPCCGQDGVETMEHVLAECPVGEGMRQRVVEAVASLWAQAGHDRDWRDWGLLEGGCMQQEGWEQWWGWAGMVPMKMAEMLDRGGVTTEVRGHLLGGTSALLTEYAKGRWEQRCTNVIEVENASGVGERKGQAGRAGWRLPRCEVRAQRGRPPKPVGELSQKYRDRKESKAHVVQAVLEMGKAEGMRTHRKWLQERARLRRGGACTKVQSSMQGYLTNRDKGWLKQSFGMRQEGGGVRHVGEPQCAQGRCVVEGCEAVGLRATLGCSKGAFRCVAHAGLSCWGGWRGCDCMLAGRGKGRSRCKGTVRGVEERQGRVQREEWGRRDALCSRVDSGESVVMRVIVGSEAVVGRVTWIVHGAPETADASGGEWSRVNEVYMDDGVEEVSVILDRVHWGIVEVDDPEYPLESPEVSEDEGGGPSEGGRRSPAGCSMGGGEEGADGCLAEGEGAQQGDQGGGYLGSLMEDGEQDGCDPAEGIRDEGGEYPVSPSSMGEACAMAPQGSMSFENQGDIFVTLWEKINWGTAVQMMSLMGDRMQDAAMCRDAAYTVLVRDYGFTQQELVERERGGEYLSSFRLPRRAVQEHEDFWRFSSEVESLGRTLAAMPRYLAAAKRGLRGEAWVQVRYVRKALRSGVRYGRAYPSVVSGDGESVLRGVPSLTAMPREVRNALISFPRQTLLDFDLAKCYPSIMLAAARMHGFEGGAMALLESLLADPKAVMARIATEAQCDTSDVKQMINRIVSDPRKRHHRKVGSWLGRFEEEVHGLRERLIDAHERGGAFRGELRDDGSLPNIGTVVYRVLTDYEVRVIEVAAMEFQKRGVRVGTYEYDGLKVEAEGWERLGPDAQRWLLQEVTRQADRVVFAGRSGGVVHLVQKEMEFEGYAQGLRLLVGTDRGVAVQGSNSGSEGREREATDDGGPQSAQEGAGEEGDLSTGRGLTAYPDDATGGEAGQGPEGSSHPGQCEEEGGLEGGGSGTNSGDGPSGARCANQGAMAPATREGVGNGGEREGKAGGSGEGGDKRGLGNGAAVGGGDRGDSDQGALHLLRDGVEAPVGDDTAQGQRAEQGEVGGVLRRCGQEQDAYSTGGGARWRDGAGTGSQRLRPRIGGRVRRRAESEWDDVWVQVEEMELPGGRGPPSPQWRVARRARVVCEGCGKSVTVNRDGRMRAHKCNQGGSQGGELHSAAGGGAGTVRAQGEAACVEDLGEDEDEDEEGGVRAAEWAAGQGRGASGGRSRGARAQLQDHCNTRVERLVLESGMWRLAECQLRPRGRAPMFSIERTRRGIEQVYRVFGLTECEVLVRFNSPLYGLVGMGDPAGTVPRGEGGHFWEEVQTARLRLQEEFRRLDENRVFDPGVGGALRGGD